MPVSGGAVEQKILVAVDFGVYSGVKMDGFAQ